MTENEYNWFEARPPEFFRKKALLASEMASHGVIAVYDEMDVVRRGCNLEDERVSGLFKATRDAIMPCVRSIARMRSVDDSRPDDAEIADSVRRFVAAKNEAVSAYNALVARDSAHVWEGLGPYDGRSMFTCALCKMTRVDSTDSARCDAKVVSIISKS